MSTPYGSPAPARARVIRFHLREHLSFAAKASLLTAGLVFSVSFAANTGAFDHNLDDGMQQITVRVE